MIARLRDTLGRHRHALSAAAIVAVTALAAVGLYRLLAVVRIHELKAALHGLSRGQLLAAVALSALSYWLLTLYDVLALRQIRRPAPYRTAALASFVSYTFSHNIGFSVVTGASARYRIYSAMGVPAGDVARVVALTSLTFWTAVGIAGALALVLAPHPLVLLHLAPGVARGAGVALLLAAAAGMAMLGKGTQLRLLGWALPLPSRRAAVLPIAVSLADLVVAGGALFVLIPGASLDQFPAFFLIYCLALIVAVVSHVPGGLGVFEAVMLLAVTGTGKSDLAAALLAYRAIYYWLPLTLAMSGLAVHEGGRWRGKLGIAADTAQAVFSTIAPPLFAALAMAGGLVLLVSGAVPAIPARLATLRMVLPLPFVEASQIAASLAGTALLLLAPGLYRRLDGAFLLARTMLVAGAVFSLMKGFDYEEACVLCAIALLLQWSRAAFYRRTRMTVDLLTPEWIGAFVLALGVSVWIGFLTHRRVEYANQLWWQFAWHGDASRFLRATLAAGVLLLGVVVLRMLSGAAPRPKREDVAPPDFAEVARGGHTEAFLALTGDKRFVRGDEAFLMYQVQGQSWIVMGDPVGPVAAWPDLLWAIRETAHTMQGRLLLYQITPAMIPFAVDLGLTLIKYGEEARVNLADFSLDGPEARPLRYAARRAEREGARFEIVPAAKVGAIMDELEAVSNAWLRHKGQGEKTFSVGRFDRAYVAQFDCAVVRAGGRIVAFANLLQTTGREELSVDLMRQVETMPYGTMDFLFAHLMEWGRQQGFAWFNLGLAPLAGIPDHRLAPVWAKAGGLLYRHGHQIYGFEGLRAYKQKFAPMWEPRYIAGPPGMGMMRALFDLQVLVGGGEASAAARPRKERRIPLAA